MSNSIIYDLVTLFTQQNNAQINLITHCLCSTKWNYWCYSFKICFQLLNYKTGLSLFISTLESAEVPMSVMQLSGFQCLFINTSNTQHRNYPFGYQSVSFWSASRKMLQYQHQPITLHTKTVLFLGFKLHQTVHLHDLTSQQQSLYVNHYVTHANCLKWFLLPSVCNIILQHGNKLYSLQLKSTTDNVFS